MNKKILVLGKNMGNETLSSTIATEDVYLELRSLGYDVFFDYVRGIKQLLELIKIRNFDKVLLLTYGDWGNDGTVQKILENLNIDFTYSNSTFSKIFYNKQLTKDFLNTNGILTPDTYNKDNIKFPCISKPYKNGGSTDVKLITSDNEFIYNESILYEEYLNNENWEEYTVAMFNGVIGIPLKIETEGEDEIWDKVDSKELVDYYNKQDSIAAFKPIGDKFNEILDYKDLIRIDYMMNKTTNEIKVLEINGMPILNKEGYCVKSLSGLDSDKYTYANILKTMIHE